MSEMTGSTALAVIHQRSTLQVPVRSLVKPSGAYKGSLGSFNLFVVEKLLLKLFLVSNLFTTPVSISFNCLLGVCVFVFIKF